MIDLDSAGVNVTQRENSPEDTFGMIVNLFSYNLVY